MNEAVIVATARTPIGRANKGSLTQVRPDDMAAHVVRAALAKVPHLPPDDIDDLVMGSGEPAGEAGFNLGRVVSVLAGLHDVPGVTVNRYCASSLQAIRMAVHAIRAGEGDAFVAGGVETVSRFHHGVADLAPPNPVFADAVHRTAERSSGGSGPWAPCDGLPDIYIAMGQTAENVAELEGVTRQEQDEFALLSQTRASAALARGHWAEEITPIATVDADGNPVTVAKDDGIRPGTTLDKLAQLAPAFKPGGTVTAGNACPLNDGAAAVVVMSDRHAAALGIQPLARVVASAVTGINPEIMGLGPVEACRLALKRAGMTMGDVDLVELNEAYAAQVIPVARHLDIPVDKLNVNGGAIALGHPFAMTGARIMTTLLHNLQTEDKVIGLETMCVGGGQGMAMVVERLG